MPRRRTPSTSSHHDSHDIVDAAKDTALAAKEQAVAAATPFGHRLADLAFGEPESPHRYIAASAAAFVLGTAVRTVCFSPKWPIFGQYLLSNLAPVERHDVSYPWIVALRVIDIAVALNLWERAGRVVDGPYLGVLQAAITRPPLYFLLHEHYLLSAKTLMTVFITDAATLATITFTLSHLLPSPSPHLSPLTLRPPLRSLQRLLHRAHLLPAALALISGTTLSALSSYLVSHTYLPDLLRTHTLKSTLPSSSPLVHHPLSGSAAIHRPTVLVPTLRYSTVLGTSRAAPSMPLQLVLSALTPALYLLLSSVVLPRAAPAHIAALVATASAAVAFITLWNVMPVTWTGAAAVAAEIATREAATAALVSWIMEDTRRPLRTLTVEKLVEDDGTEVTRVTAAVQVAE